MIDYAYKVGQKVEAIDPLSRRPVAESWREAVVVQLAPSRGRPGYYLQWCKLPKMPDGISPSSGGWCNEPAMRPINN